MPIQKPFDFVEIFRDPKVFLAEEAAFQIVDNDVFSIWNMSEHELLEAIIEDILAVTMWEKQTEKAIHFTAVELVRFLRPARSWSKVLNTLPDPRIRNMISNVPGELIRIKDNPEILQMAMDFCGVWYTGFKPSKETKVIIPNREMIQTETKKYGDISTLAKSLMMDASSIFGIQNNISKNH